MEPEGMEVAIVPHTHWDREWYVPFQTYRLRLVSLLDEFLALLERDPGYRHFLLDGQTAVVDDYLEVRPDAEERLRALVAAGRLSVGPWAVLMDEFMVSGETMVRNLQTGLARAADLGGAMEVGYLPDMFGHVAQMPQILALAGLEHAVVWRGVPAGIRSTGFWWEAPDGSRVRAEYLYGSYSNGRDLPREPEMLVERAAAFEAELGDARLEGMLLMNGTDHQVPQPWLGQVVEAANAARSGYEFRVTSLPEYLARRPASDDLPTWRGELRSGARANLLMGVASNRVDVHRAAAAAERAVERRAEPLAALVLAPDHYPARLLELAWRNLVLNSAHDSSCACSHDEVVEQVMVRYREARQIGDGVARDTVHLMGALVDAPAGSTVVVNPSPWPRRGLVEVSVPGRGPLHFEDPEGRALPAQVVDSEPGTGEIAEQLETVFSLRMLREPRRRAVFATDTVPGYGWRTYVPRDGNVPARPVTAGPAMGNRDHMRNEHVEVTVDRGDGTFTLTTSEGLCVSGLNRYVNGGDGGDTYNYSPPDEDVIVDRPETVLLQAEGKVDENQSEQGPLRARLGIVSTYRWPTHAEGDERKCTRRAADRVDVEVRTTLELRTGEPFVRVRVELDNPCRDQRLRAHFPLPEPVEGSDAECAFAVVHRALTAEGGPGEVGLPTFPSRRFVDCSGPGHGLALVHDGLLEYEVVGNGTELALTLMRSVGWLSRIEPQLRPNPAGPPVPVAGAQMPGRQVFEYAVLLHRGGWEDADLHRVADDVLLPLERAPAGGEHDGEHSTGPRTGSLLEVEGAQVSACHRDPSGNLVLRVFNPSGESTQLHVRRHGAAASGQVVDLRGRPLAPFSGEITLAPSEIATLQLPAV